MKIPFKSDLKRHLQRDDKMFTASLQASMMLIDDDDKTHPKEVCTVGHDKGA
jgi:hypothetical protein